MKPVRRVATSEDLERFTTSETYTSIVSFIEELNASVKGHELGVSDVPSPVIKDLLAILDSVSGIIHKYPPGEASSRFGKPEFREFYDEMTRMVPHMLERLHLENAEEAATYFTESWGNRERIDYGSGHELNFLCFLLFLRKAGKLKPSDDKDVVLAVFAKYLKVMRKLQRAYWLEPAGSHGVWGLDDYHFLPFLFGSGQLAPHKYLRPINIHDNDIVDMFADKYLYFSCIQFINSVKTASLRWHSPMLDDISGVKKWQKVNEGMIKMYKAEVLGKLPIMQHFLFGDTLPAPQGVSAPGQALQEHQHGWGDCCGIKVPSAVAASEKSSLRSIPFD